ncbi:FliC/FljB family flagellin [Arsenophonus nasoniae]|uniref:Flagellin n=2 Tax=Arsenophonus nasoniae TaxID=638 RepID=A0A4P7KZN1_9GAMM|nr:FliC/FljB family flagellin [Arsenophonus nasoniae]QBY42978.1 Flagellin [Arsenophonus nasoniae]WGM02748.1 FliC/FljB family flagellin [Arsenophonus nasoniae]WGM07021.1 FliC/FljB family flagellin [Arsenophonus nasoniae]WGM11901.1 FliC/FljB family flagellin [Arsenophonus nasoniae]WGM16585.1 FliC/FljB family flagellin [Arsenophonus nasoniae]
MALVINTNMSALNAQKALNRTQDTLGTTIQRLSTGLRINSAKDDAAGMSIANGMTSNIMGMTQAARNANDGISLAQTTEGALAQVNDNLQAIRRLAVQASNGTNSASDIATLQNEVKQRLDEINRISEQTDFNGTKVLSANTMKTIQIGANYGETIEIGLEKITSGELKIEEVNLNAFALVYADYNATAATDAELEAAFKDKFPTTATAALAAANIKIGTTALTGTQKLHQKIDAATGKAVDGQYVLVDSTTTNATKVYEVNLAFGQDGSTPPAKTITITQGKEITADAVAGDVDVKLTTARNGMLATDKILSSLDDALTSVSGLRSSLGAMQNRFEAAVENLNNTINNLSSARSRIQDADFADEVSRLSNGQILQQAGTTVLAMANQSTQSVLSLLR